MTAQPDHALDTRHIAEGLPMSAHTASSHPHLVTVSALADYLGVHFRTIQRWTLKKQIPYYRVEKSIRFNLTDVLDAMASDGK